MQEELAAGGGGGELLGYIYCKPSNEQFKMMVKLIPTLPA